MPDIVPDQTFDLTPLGAVTRYLAGNVEQAQMILHMLELHARRKGLGATKGCIPVIVMDGKGWEFAEVELNETE